MNTASAPSVNPPVAVILAAGKGTRMRSDLPKVLHPVGGRPMLCAVIDACRQAGCRRIILVVGYKQELVRRAIADQGEVYERGIEFAVQAEQLGTGHAVMCVRPNVNSLLEAGAPETDLFVLAGDGPLIRGSTLRTLLARHRDVGAAATLATSVIPDPTGYGRIVRGREGRLERIVEHKEATAEQLKIREVNPSYYCFNLRAMMRSLERVKRNEGSGEYYITDVPTLLMAEGKGVEVIDAVPPQDVLSINTPEQLAEVDGIYRARHPEGIAEMVASGQAMQVVDFERNGTLKIFSGRVSADLTGRICDHLQMRPGQARVETFPDGETIVKLEDDVRGRDCYVVASTCMPVNDNLMELLVYIDCLKRASAKRVTAVIPYFGYARQDRKDEGRVPITAKLVANLITAAKADRVLAIDLHAAQIQGFFDLPVDHLTATPVFADYFMAMRQELGDLCLVSPDVGNVKVAEAFANLLGGDLAIIMKRRISGSEVTTGNIIGSVKGKTVLMFDDMIATGGTIVQAAELVMSYGAKQVIAAATHAVLAGPAVERLARSPVAKVVTTNTIPGGERFAPLAGRHTQLCVGDLLGEAIYRIHNNLSISALFKKTAGVKR